MCQHLISLNLSIFMVSEILKVGNGAVAWTWWWAREGWRIAGRVGVFGCVHYYSCPEYKIKSADVWGISRTSDEQYEQWDCTQECRHSKQQTFEFFVNCQIWQICMVWFQTPPLISFGLGKCCYLRLVDFHWGMIIWRWHLLSCLADFYLSNVLAISKC